MASVKSLCSEVGDGGDLGTCIVERGFCGRAEVGEVGEQEVGEYGGEMSPIPRSLMDNGFEGFMLSFLVLVLVGAGVLPSPGLAGVSTVLMAYTSNLILTSTSSW